MIQCFKIQRENISLARGSRDARLRILASPRLGLAIVRFIYRIVRCAHATRTLMERRQKERIEKESERERGSVFVG